MKNKFLSSQKFDDSVQMNTEDIYDTVNASSIDEVEELD